MMRNGVIYELQISELPIRDLDGFALPIPEGGYLPTPTRNEQKYRLKGNTQASKNLEARARRGELSNTGEKGSLNPEYVEWMMGFPIGWTE